MGYGHGYDPGAVTTPPELTPARVEGLYIHVPFCRRKCGYCDFYSVVAGGDEHRRFAARLIDEAHAASALARGPVRTVFVGGGTPTVLSGALWAQILGELRRAFDLSALDEFTFEANPETVDADLVQTLAACGADRLSIGAQSCHPRHLRTLDRAHDPESVRRAVSAAHACGIGNVSLDLIFGIPGEALDEWAADLDAALELAPSHLSCYGLTYEEGTLIARRVAQGRLRPCDEDTEAAMYEMAIRRLSAAGFEHYEVSNFARPGRRCLHNMLYWTNANWLGLGPAAASHVDGVRWKNAPDLMRYLESEGRAPVAEVEKLPPDASFGEQLMLRLRLIEGAPVDWLEPRLDDRRSAVIAGFEAEGLLERTPTHLRLTRRGLLVADTVVSELL